MDIVIRGRGTNVPTSLKQATREKLAKLDRFAQGHGRIEVDYFEQRNPRVHDHHEVEVIVHLKGHLVKGHAAATDHFAALDLVIDKVEQQVRKLKERRVGRSHPRRRATDQVPPRALDDDADRLAELLADLPPVTDEEWPEEPALVVRRKVVGIKPMTTDEAALQMELLNHDFFFFTHAESGRAAVLYRRRDGHLGLLEAEA